MVKNLRCFVCMITVMLQLGGTENGTENGNGKKSGLNLY